MTKIDSIFEENRKLRCEVKILQRLLDDLSRQLEQSKQHMEALQPFCFDTRHKVTANQPEPGTTNAPS